MTTGTVDNPHIESGDGELAPLPGQVAEAFYDVRFGALALDKSRVKAVEQALTRLEQAAKRRGR